VVLGVDGQPIGDAVSQWRLDEPAAVRYLAGAVVVVERVDSARLRLGEVERRPVAGKIVC